MVRWKDGKGAHELRAPCVVTERKMVYLHALAHSMDAENWWGRLQPNDQVRLQDAVDIDATTCLPEIIFSC